ncbi:MAG: hypothetical protein ACXV0U_09140 [Kineosporiaceae bacterium]
MSTHSGEDDGLEATEVPETPRSVFDPDRGDAPEADAPDAGGDDDGDDGGPGNSDPGF